MAFLSNNSRIALILFSCLVMSFHSSASAQNYGTATYYTPPYMPSACYGFADQGVMIAAASEAIWNGGGACGQYYQVTCVSGTNAGTPYPCQGSSSVVVKIVDLCPAGSCRGTIDLSQEAFASVADTASGVINISYQQI
ncbi:EG45-like domain containing protein [Citrus sinensis]|uniref:EG45-like domain containing protein n=1 Tax=Citrus sinensis TaxID=2711 RepID=UPI000CED6564|nr:EG45-like domain containing protein [Citrus sinensis]XP_024048206.1 EG45-like domain containing protein [Citrus x clementina]